MLITNETHGTDFRAAFEANLTGSSSIKIASGYFGASEVENYGVALCDIARNGGSVELIHGMGGVEGIRKNLYNKLRDLDDSLRATGDSNRIFIHKTHYHGKMYITSDQVDTKVLIGSSNFSNSGFGRNIELNHCHTDRDTCNEANLFFNRLKSNSIQIDKFLLPDRTQIAKKATKFPAFDPTVLQGVPDASVAVRVTERSNLNLFLSTGRINRTTGVYSPRPFYEVELTIGKDDLPTVRPYLPNQIEPAEFRAVTDVGTTFNVKFKRKTSKRGETKTLHETGIDFMSSPRDELGQYMKQKLMRAGLLHFGEPITYEVLADYGNSKLNMFFVEDSVVYLKF